jgi:hypothetical protein
MTGVRPRFRPHPWFGCCLPGTGNSQGAVTAEFAVALPAVLLLLALLLAGAAAGTTQLRLEEAALAGARALARGESPAAAEAMVRRLAGASATAAIVDDGEWVSVTVADRVAGPLGSMVPWTLTARASARNESAGSLGWDTPGPAARGGTIRDVIAGGSTSRDVIASGPPLTGDVISGGSTLRDVIALGQPAGEATAPGPPPQAPDRPRPLPHQPRSLADMA